LTGVGVEPVDLNVDEYVATNSWASGVIGLAL
jgi:hypothetical protein